MTDLKTPTPDAAMIERHATAERLADYAYELGPEAHAEFVEAIEQALATRATRKARDTWTWKGNVMAYVLTSWDDVPERFTDPRCDEFTTVCSNGFHGDLSVGSAFLHKPKRWPQCFPNGEGGDACCTTVVLRKTP
jgi:hypothetical protein